MPSTHKGHLTRPSRPDHEPDRPAALRSHEPGAPELHPSIGQLTHGNPTAPAELLVVQQTAGNRAVQRMVTREPRSPASRPACPVQAKLTVGPVDDPCEREADRVAKGVVKRLHAPSSASTPAGGVNERPVSDIQGRPNKSDGLELSPHLEASIERARPGGEPLSSEIRRPFEGAFGVDFGGVRVHTGAPADQLSRAVRATAFTSGSDVFFSSGSFDPSGSRGHELIAHELTHVVQQGKAIPTQSIFGKQLSDSPLQRSPGADDAGASSSSASSRKPPIDSKAIKNARKRLGGAEAVEAVDRLAKWCSSADQFYFFATDMEHLLNWRDSIAAHYSTGEDFAEKGGEPNDETLASVLVFLEKRKADGQPRQESRAAWRLLTPSEAFRRWGNVRLTGPLKWGAMSQSTGTLYWDGLLIGVKERETTAHLTVHKQEDLNAIEVHFTISTGGLNGNYFAIMSEGLKVEIQTQGEVRSGTPGDWAKLDSTLRNALVLLLKELFFERSQ